MYNCGGERVCRSIAASSCCNATQYSLLIMSYGWPCRMTYLLGYNPANGEWTVENADKRRDRDAVLEPAGEE